MSMPISPYTTRQWVFDFSGYGYLPNSVDAVDQVTPQQRVGAAYVPADSLTDEYGVARPVNDYLAILAGDDAPDAPAKQEDLPLWVVALIIAGVIATPYVLSKLNI